MTETTVCRQGRAQATVWTSFVAISGLIHIVVISGLKVSLLARIIHNVLGRCLPRAAPIIPVAAMAGYPLLAGASAAALRAAAMGMLVVLAARLHCETHIAVSLALTGAVMLALKPALAHDVSFQLSFAGTIGITAMTDGVAARLKWMPIVVRDPSLPRLPPRPRHGR